MVTFEIKEKVALVTGGASGIGFSYAVAILEAGARGVTLVDINPQNGARAVQELNSKFGENKAIFVKADVSNTQEFEDAFKKTVDTFGNIDILVNNAGIANDTIWEKEVEVNVKGVINGVLLGLENYLQKYRSGSDAVIVNVSSLSGIEPWGFMPIYVGTKFAVHGMTLSWGLPAHYNRTKVRVVGVCPGVTQTPAFNDVVGKNLGPAYEQIRLAEFNDPKIPLQTSEQAAQRILEVTERAESGTMWVVDGGAPPYQFQLPNRFEMVKKYLQ